MCGGGKDAGPVTPATPQAPPLPHRQGYAARRRTGADRLRPGSRLCAWRPFGWRPLCSQGSVCSEAADNRPVGSLRASLSRRGGQYSFQRPEHAGVHSMRCDESLTGWRQMPIDFMRNSARKTSGDPTHPRHTAGQRLASTRRCNERCRQIPGPQWLRPDRQSIRKGA